MIKVCLKPLISRGQRKKSDIDSAITNSLLNSTNKASSPYRNVATLCAIYYLIGVLYLLSSPSELFKRSWISYYQLCWTVSLYYLPVLQSLEHPSHGFPAYIEHDSYFHVRRRVRDDCGFPARLSSIFVDYFRLVAFGNQHPQLTANPLADVGQSQQ